MNAQTHFQQFVSSNKGKLITFKHQGSTISKYVVDVCGEYFTCKGRETDAKIDGFYYFSDCEMYKPTLIETLARHRYVVLIGEKSPMCDAFFEYNYCKEANNTLMVIGKQLSATNPEVGYAAPYIGEVWAIVEGKYTKVWEKTNGGFLIDGDDLKKIGIRKFDAISEGSKKQSLDDDDVKERQKVQWYKDNANDWIELCEKCGSNKPAAFKRTIKRIIEEEYSQDLYNELCYSYEGLRDWVISAFKNNRNIPRVQALTKRFLVLSNEFRKKFGNNGVHKLLGLIDEEISIKGEEEYERLFEDKVDEEEIKKQKVQWYKDTANDWIGLCKEEGSTYSDNFINIINRIKSEPYSKELYDGLCLSYENLRDSFLRTFKGEFNRPRVQALTKRFLVLTTEFRKKFGNNDSSVNSLVEFINKEMSIEGGIIYRRKFEDKVSDKTGPVKKIEYRGKEKTVEIMNEYTHRNGKSYIWVRDLSDKGKTKTLFKEYVKYV